MTILAHPLNGDPAGPAYYHRLREMIDRGDGYTEAVVTEAASGRAVGERYLFDASGARVAALAAAPDWEAVAARLAPLGSRPRPSAHAGVAYLPSLPRDTLLLVGAGHVAQAVARLAAELDFNVWVLDDRTRYASSDRFPAAERLLVGNIGETLRDLAPTLTPATYALVVTRGHGHDEESLYHLAGTACGYVGMIGSRRKVRLIFADLAAKGVPEEALARVRAPVGVEIGSQTVPEIAVSIAAELVARRNLGARP
jgi:xanthine dehydrogenase accessory factor